MSAIDNILEQSVRVLQGVGTGVADDRLQATGDRSGHGVALQLNLNGSADPVVVAGYAQVLASDPIMGRRRSDQYQQLHVLDNLPTHAVYILRSDLEDAEVDPALVREITPTAGPDSEVTGVTATTYRVRYFTNDVLASPELIFFCTLG